ncbi:MAG: copper chaperone NosL [Salibacteraceae bacterium]|jgi:copper chaperone NosL
MRYLKFGAMVLVVVIFTACNVEPEAINYGEDQCDFCKMGVVDKSHAAQYVTKKGKQYKFDAIECLMREIANPEIILEDMAYVLVADYQNPGQLIAASEATFIICKKIKSPMGAYLSAFSDVKEAQKAIAKLGGVAYDWSGIQNKFKKK